MESAVCFHKDKEVSIFESSARWFAVVVRGEGVHKAGEEWKCVVVGVVVSVVHASYVDPLVSNTIGVCCTVQINA